MAPESFYTVKNVVRRVQTRLRRYAAPGRQHFKQYIGAQRLLRNQELVLPESQFKKVEASLFEGLRNGAFEITDPEGWVYFADASGILCKKKDGKVSILQNQNKTTLQKKPTPTSEKMPPPETSPATVSEVTEPPVETAIVAQTIVEPPLEMPIVESAEGKPKVDSVKDNLTELPGVGTGRARKLEASGISSFKQVSEMLPSLLVKILGPTVTEDQAVDICNAASEKVG